MNHFGPDKPSAALAAIEDASKYSWKGYTSTFRTLLHDDSGQDMIEYALVAALVGLGGTLAIKNLKNSIGLSFNGIGNSLTNAVA